MEINFNLTGENRKDLAQAVSEITDLAMNYKGVPTFAYEIGDFLIDKEGTLIFPDGTDNEYAKKVMSELSKLGFNPQVSTAPDRLVIEVLLKDFTEENISNLAKLIASKANLIKKAVGASELNILRTSTTLKFPWFNLPAHGPEVAAYSQFVSALCAAAKVQKRVTAKEKNVENEKFAFRVFLIRLGFVGDDYKEARKILLKNLSGNSAFKSGKPSTAEVSDAE